MLIWTIKQCLYRYFIFSPGEVTIEASATDFGVYFLEFDQTGIYDISCYVSDINDNQATDQGKIKVKGKKQCMYQ